MKPKYDQLPLPHAATFPRMQDRTAMFPRLQDETREFVPTDCAAYHLNRRPQTLREWSHYGSGLIQPVRIGSRLGWRTADIRRVLGVAE